MKRILIAVAVLVVLIIVAALVVPALIPVETYKQQLLAQVKEATGREAKIDGDFGFSILPNVEFVAGKVSFANAPGGKAPQMVTLDRLNVQVALWPLLSGDVRIGAFVLKDPVIHLEVDKNGKPNWQFETAKPGAPAAKPAETGGGAGGGMGLSGLSLGDVRLENGRITYADARTGASYDVGEINMKLALPSLDSPMTADGSLFWNQKKVGLAAKLTTPDTLLNQKPTEIDAKVTSGPVNLSFNGSATMGKALKAGGKLDLDVPSVRGLADWAGAPLQVPPGETFGPLKIAGTVDVNGQRYAFKNAKLAFDKLSGTGDVAFDGSGRKPAVSAKLATGVLDVNPYLPPEKAGGQGGASAQAGSAQQGGGDWSDDPIDLSGLNAANADLDLTVAGLIVKKIKIGESNVHVTLKDGVLVTDLTKMALYDGTGKAKLTANGAGKTPTVDLTFDLANFQANPFMTDAMGFERIEGTANADLKMATRGNTQRQMISALNGGGKVQFLNGAIRGINLAAMVRNVTSAFLDPKAREQQKTDFAELGGTYTITNGILKNDDLALKSPLLRLAGKGTVNLPDRSMNYRVEPKLVATTQGQGGASDVGGIKVPVIIAGKWDNLSYKPDLSGIVEGVAKDPSKALDTLKNQIPGLGGSGSSSGGSSSGSSGSGVLPNPKDAIKNLFGR